MADGKSDRVWAETEVNRIERAPIPHKSKQAKNRIPRLNSKSHRKSSINVSASSLDGVSRGQDNGHNHSTRDVKEYHLSDDETVEFVDTDLEDEEPSNRKSSFDPTGRRLYHVACKRHHVIPSNRFVRQLALDNIDMSKASLGRREIEVMSYAITANTLTTELNLSDNCLGPEGARLLAQGLRDNVFIRYLNLADNSIGTEGARAICGLFCDSCEIRDVNLSGNGFKETDAEFFAQALSMNYILKKLDLSHNEFREVGGEILAKAIASNDALEELNLSWNHLRLKGGRAIGSAIKFNQSIRILDLSWNGLSNDGAYYIAASLKENSTLQELDMTCNRITIEGAAFFFTGLKINETLQILKMGLNPVTSTGVSKLLDAIKRNPDSGMNRLELVNTPVTYTVGALVAEIQSFNPSFELIHGGYVSSDDAYAKRYAQKYEVDPFFLLMTYVREQGFRLLDMFIQFDVNHDWSISRAEFVKGLQMAKIPLTQGQLEKLLEQLDKDNDGNIDLSEFLEGEKEFKKKQRRLLKGRAMARAAIITNLKAPRPESADAVRAGSLPAIVKTRSARPQSVTPETNNRRGSQMPAGNYLDLVITTNDDNKTRIEGRPRSAVDRKSPIIPFMDTSRSYTPPAGESWSRSSSPVYSDGGHNFSNVVINALSRKHNIEGQENFHGVVK